MVLGITKMYHMLGYSEQNEIVLLTPHSNALCRAIRPEARTFQGDGQGIPKKGHHQTN